MTILYSPKDIEVARGLKGVASHATQLSEVDGQAGRLVIRGYDIHELAGRVTFEETAYLLWYGDLPNRQQLDACQQEMAVARHLPGPIMDVLRGAARHATGMHALRMGAASLSLDELHADDLSSESNRRLALRITARMPALVARASLPAPRRSSRSTSHRITSAAPLDISICLKVTSQTRHEWKG